ncbi:DUF6480 family protein [Actinokineospora soli]|uniref:DUF6480 family protein n=1 Tax=Actinokineospora soli TaxID=1048753 RepID=A0ABW2TUD9_9PSEU
MREAVRGRLRRLGTGHTRRHDRAPPDPDPDRTPGLEPGGGVRPGDTPPTRAARRGGWPGRSPGPAGRARARSSPWGPCSCSS